MARRRTPEVLSEFASPAVHDETRRVMSQVRRRGYVAAAQAIHDADALPAARSWKGPTLLVWGELDTVTPLAYAERLRAVMPQAELAILPRASHMVYLEQEGLFDETVAGFAERAHAGM
jgi:pimeloyl-ACP methyl ester carboxylesterase